MLLVDIMMWRDLRDEIDRLSLQMASPSPSTTLAEHPRHCCIQSVRHTGTPIGSIETLAGTNTYITRDDPRRGDQDKYQQILFYFSDVFGPLYVNNQLLMDYFASRGKSVRLHTKHSAKVTGGETEGYLVVSLDYFEGDKLEALRAKPGFDLAAWGMDKHSRAKELIPGWISAVKAKYGPCVCNASKFHTTLMRTWALGTEGTKYMAVGEKFLTHRSMC
jgi:hypothetical protein